MNARFDLSHIATAADALDTLCEGDERLFADMLVGETDIDHICRRIWEQIALDEEMLVGLKERKAALADRQQRIEARRDGAKALIGRVLRAGHLTKLELPEVTLSVRDGKPSLKVGRSGRSIRRAVRIAVSPGRPSRRKNEPGILPAA